VGVTARAELAAVRAITAAPTTIVTAPMSICSRRCNPLRGAVEEVSRIIVVFLLSRFELRFRAVDRLALNP
jgi:hypothetical protein